MNLTGDTNTPALPMTDAEVNHLRRLLAWMRCEWTLDEDMQRGYMLGAAATVAHGMQTPEQAGVRLVERAEQINKAVPLYVRQAVKMLTKALRDHERKAGIVDSAAVTPHAGKGYEVLTVSAGSPRPPAWATDGEQ
jgi:hypothetical protein